jgi:hypothetical protein
MAGLANMATVISPNETSLFICAPPYDMSDWLTEKPLLFPAKKLHDDAHHQVLI